MSIALGLAELERDPPRAIVRYRPKLKGRQRHVRQMSIEAKISDWLQKPTHSPDQMQLKEAILAHFRQFVLGERVDDCDYMKRVEDRRISANRKFDQEVWSIRTRFDPQHRFFGFFALPDWFVVLSKQSRERLDDPGEWHRQIDKAARTWAAMLPGRAPLTGRMFSDLVTSNWEHCDERWYPI